DHGVLRLVRGLPGALCRGSDRHPGLRLVGARLGQPRPAPGHLPAVRPAVQRAGVDHPDPDAGHVGARVLPGLPERQGRLRQGVLEHRQLAGRGRPLREGARTEHPLSPVRGAACSAGRHSPRTCSGAGAVPSLGSTRAAERAAPEAEALCDSQAPCQRISRTHLPDRRAKAAAAPPVLVPSTLRAPAAVTRSLRAPAPAPVEPEEPEEPEEPVEPVDQQRCADQGRRCERSLVVPRLLRAEGTRERPAARCASLRGRQWACGPRLYSSTCPTRPPIATTNPMPVIHQPAAAPRNPRVTPMAITSGHQLHGEKWPYSPAPSATSATGSSSGRASIRLLTRM